MSYTKRQFVTAAFEEIGLASFVYDITDAELISAVRRLDTMMADWNAKGVRLSYPIPSTPEATNADSETDVPDMANEAIITNLAVRIAPGYGKVVSPDTKFVAKNAYNVLMARVAADNMIEKQLPSFVPAGAGHKSWRHGDPFLADPTDSLDAGPDSEIDFF
jgi:hypothetical protein